MTDLNSITKEELTDRIKESADNIQKFKNELLTVSPDNTIKTYQLNRNISIEQQRINNFNEILKLNP